MWGGAISNRLPRPPPALRFSEHLEGDGAMIFERACRLGLEGIVQPARLRVVQHGLGQRATYTPSPRP